MVKYLTSTNMNRIKIYWKFILFYAILLAGFVYNLATGCYEVLTFNVVILLITILWNKDYAKLVSHEQERDTFSKELRKKYNRVIEVEKVRYSNLFSQNESLLKEVDELKQTIHDLTEEKNHMRNKLNAIRRRRNQKKQSNE